MAKLVTGLFKARAGAMLAIEDLVRHQVPEEDISIMMTDTASGREFYTEMASKAPEYGVGGAIIGGIVGGVLTSLVTLGYLADPGLGLAHMMIVMSTLVGIGAGMVAGLILGLFAGATVPEFETNFYPVGGKHSGYLVGVYCHPRREFEVRRLIEAAGGTNVRVKTVRDTPLKVYGIRDYVSTASAAPSTPQPPPLPPEPKSETKPTE